MLNKSAQQYLTHSLFFIFYLLFGDRKSICKKIKISLQQRFSTVVLWFLFGFCLDLGRDDATYLFYHF